MQCQKFWTNKVVTAGDIMGDSSSEMPVIRDELFGAPLASGAIVAVFHDFEPAISGGIVGSSGVVDFLHIDRARTFVTRINRSWLRSIGPIAPFERESIACVDAGDTRHASLAIDT